MGLVPDAPWRRVCGIVVVVLGAVAVLVLGSARAAPITTTLAGSPPDEFTITLLLYATRNVFWVTICTSAPLEPAGSVFADAVEVIGACAAAARRRLGVIGAVSAWQQASALTGGRLLAPAGPAEWINTSRLLGAAG